MDCQLDAIRASIDLRVYVVEQGIKLKKRGRIWAALCPFHKESTPSFHINSDLQVFICRGCGAGGDLFTFTELFHGVPFIEAKKILAERAGISLDRFTAEDRAEYARYRAEIERAEEWRRIIIEDIYSMRDDYFGLYHQAKRLIRKHGLALIFIGAAECGGKYRKLDECLDALRNASPTAILEAYRSRIEGDCQCL